ncbi:recombinase family protein [Gymnodinialimonas ceratoperidinii]|uniref:FlgN protein n=1 Tax=Gymnodinialimonas ceratoperidinii TaxID=2856823 RepID=A0A8F6TY71_9RHOB|nr:recombinase family protein [Gymnodinialimonas ceratoperidinii]QXT39871.1 hypothetical protein KYE46_01010 [Gymnodinialimonas ceratoperidinii]
MIGRRKPAVESLSELLQQQHDALLAGDLKTLGRMAPVLERAFERLRRDGGDVEDVKRIQSTAARNARLLLAAKSGIAAARGHLQSARSSELTTYNADGRPQKGLPKSSTTSLRR